MRLKAQLALMSPMYKPVLNKIQILGGSISPKRRPETNKKNKELRKELQECRDKIQNPINERSELPSTEQIQNFERVTRSLLGDLVAAGPSVMNF